LRSSFEAALEEFVTGVADMTGGILEDSTLRRGANTVTAVAYTIAEEHHSRRWQTQRRVEAPFELGSYLL
jgi:hypothetical protein